MRTIRRDWLYASLALMLLAGCAGDHRSPVSPDGASGGESAGTVGAQSNPWPPPVTFPTPIKPCTTTTSGNTTCRTCEYSHSTVTTCWVKSQHQS